MNDILKIHDAHATQMNNSSNWVVSTNKGDKLIATLPSTLSEKEVFVILDMAKDAELEAFNNGITLGKEKTVKVYDALKAEYENNINAARAENERLATALEKHIISEE